MDGRRLLRDLGGPERFPFLGSLGLPADDLGRLDVASGTIRAAGMYVEAESGDSRLLQVGDAVPAGVWIAQRDLDDLRDTGDPELAGGHGFGEGWGVQGPQIGENPPEEPGAGELLTDAYLPGATGDPAQDPAAERRLTPEVPHPEAVEAGRVPPAGVRETGGL